MARSGGNTQTAERMAATLASGGIGFADNELTVEIEPLTMELKQYNVYLFSLYPEVLEKRCGSAGVYRIPACEHGQRVSKPYVLPSIVRQPYVDANDGVLKSKDLKGEFVAEDLMRPYMAGTTASVWSFGQNWDDFGAFWSLNAIPTDEEIAKARTKLEKTLRAALDEATKLESQNKLGDITPLMRHAAKYYGEDRAWDKTYKKTGECPACGQPAKDGIIMHTCGYVFDWDRAIAGGLKTYEQAVAAGAKKPKKSAD